MKTDGPSLVSQARRRVFLTTATALCNMSQNPDACRTPRLTCARSVYCKACRKSLRHSLCYSLGSMQME